VSPQPDGVKGAVGLRRSAPIFPVRDLDAALAFYTGLGFSVSRYEEGYGFAKRERLRPHLGVTPGLDPLTNHSAVYVDTDELDALHAEWSGRGLWAVPPIVGPQLREEVRRRWQSGEPIARITDAVEAKPWGVRSSRSGTPITTSCAAAWKPTSSPLLLRYELDRAAAVDRVAAQHH
jgi:catechol 2,3-dioxygenase-like lactoylglutathione lyase family enzyme